MDPRNVWPLIQTQKRTRFSNNVKGTGFIALKTRILYQIQHE